MTARHPGESAQATSFGAAAADYDRYRPQPSRQAVEWVLRTSDSDVVDVGAGTGQLTRLLLARGAAVTAVEPDPAMRLELERRAPGARVVDGVAEQLPVGDGSQDAVLSHAAWHWFDLRRTVGEAARVLRPGGRLGVLQTGFDPEVDWIAELWDRFEPDPLARRPGGRAALRSRLPGAGAVRRLRHGRLFGSFGAPFSPQEHHVVRFSRRFTGVQLVGLVGTYSGLLVRPPDERDALLADARELIEARVAGSAAIDVPMLTRCWRAERLDPERRRPRRPGPQRAPDPN